MNIVLKPLSMSIEFGPAGNLLLILRLECMQSKVHLNGVKI
jgi:hypothetical protein